jgi:SAM-dependent methyltransferase
MGTIKENRDFWSTYAWAKAGDEWSQAWGGTPFLWHGVVYPRILSMVPADCGLEIAPGHGRFTQYLKDLCRYLHVVDLAAECIEVCRQRFAAETQIDYHVNDGKSLEFISDRSLDFVFSFDSLVHAEEDVLHAYLDQLSRKLKPDALGFLHHSNMASFRDPASGKLSCPNDHWRAESMSAELFREFCNRCSLKCIVQELVNWGVPETLTDCFSVFTPRGSRYSKPFRMRENRQFMHEAVRLSAVSELYGVSSVESQERASSGSTSMAPDNDYFFEHAGRCPVCDREVTFVAECSWFRDYLICPLCRSIPRERALMYCIEQFFPQWRNFDIHESSPVARGASVKLRTAKNYVCSQYVPSLQPGERSPDGWINQDLENQTFGDEAFDLVVTQDVFEHVFDVDAAFREIARTLRPGGAHIFTTPLVRKALPTQARAWKDAGGCVRHLAEPEYHANPVDPEGGSFVTWHFGFDLAARVLAVASMPTIIVAMDRLDLGIRAEYIEVLVSFKNARTEAS